MYSTALHDETLRGDWQLRHGTADVLWSSSGTLTRV